MQNRTDVAIVIVAGGRGVRLGGMPKQYRELAGRTVLSRTIDAFRDAIPEARIQPVIAAGDRDLFADSFGSSPIAIRNVMPPVEGGPQRQSSVYNGLMSLVSFSPEIVLIHDAARPFVTSALIAKAVEAAHRYGAAIPGVRVSDTVKTLNGEGNVAATLERAKLRAIQTPQAFRFGLILEAHRRMADADLTDDGAVAEACGHAVHVFEGDPSNVKITTMEDLVAAQARYSERLSDIRIGQGYDVHALEPGDKVWFGGVAIPHDQALVGHSDADVVSHAVTDAILGALADGDIGSHFPPSDPQWRGVASSIFLAHAASRVRERGGMIAHIDATVVCERPKVGPYRDAIRASLAAIMGIEVGRVAVKATTSERLGFPGREEGIVAMATATIRLPENG